MAGITTTKNLQRIRGRGLLLSTLEKDVILTRVKVFENGCLKLETTHWDEYWQPVRKLSQGEIEENVNALHIAWNNYIHSGFNALLGQNLCYRYFSLLDTLFSLRLAIKAQEWLHLLQLVLGFECFGIASASDNKVLAGGTCTLRNPCYLLAKIKMPESLDDSKFLPVITVPGTGEQGLFYHYRQYTISGTSPLSLLLYPSVSEKRRSASFKLIGSFVGRVRDATDPRTFERARRLYRSIIRPLVESNNHSGEVMNLELADIGAGSGSLSASICREVQNSEITCKLRLWFVDLEPADPARFFRSNKLRASTDSLYFVGDDYRDWLTQPQPLPAKNGLRIALISKLFNNFSTFSIRRLSGEELSPILEHYNGNTKIEEYLPSICLAPHGTGKKSLVISNTRIYLQEGRAFSQASLSRFYEGIYFLTGKGLSDESSESGVFLPVRLFNPECLITLNNKSIIACLSESCDYVIIEDADLRPQNVIDHVEKYSLSSLNIYDMTKALRLKGNYLYVIWNSKAVNPNLSGDQLW
ncbi:MAG: hypothetical protein JW915_01075 [Chitinispirillaceae bacterium]|nr:hypothetical protein [Chitinispirillaceae bacterium]